MKRLTLIFAVVLLFTACGNNNNATEAGNAISEESEEKQVDHSQYHSINQENMQKVYDFIKSCGSTYFLATTDGDQPRVRPFGTVNIFEGKLYIQTGHKKDVAKQIAADPKVELCCYDGKSEWLRVGGTLVEDERIEAKKSMLDAYPNLRAMYDENDDNTAVYYITGARARFCSFTKPEDVVEF